MRHKEEEEKTAFGGEPNEKYQSQIFIKKESGEDEYFDSTDEPKEPNLILQIIHLLIKKWIVKQQI